MKSNLLPLNFKAWIDEHRHLLKPPVCNQQIWENREFMVTVVGGPNSRSDFHINEGEEFFYQLEGKMILRLLEGKDGEPPTDMPIGEGEIFLLPPNLPHSPQRFANTVCLVLERKRRPQELDGFLWICEKCHFKLHDEFLHVTNIVTQLPPVFDRFWNHPTNTVCKKCGHHATKP